MKYVTIINEKQFEIEIDNAGAIRVNGQPRTVDFLPLTGALYSILMDNRSYEVLVEEREGEVEVIIRGRRYNASVMDERALLLSQTRGELDNAHGEVVVKAPMPGLIVALPLSEGAEVKKGQTILILESMKMQNELKAPKDGAILRVHVVQGQSVEQNKPLITIG
ncbi:MAG: acetyl-CoA carboxylase biotin carboxyl carrier protein subunit [Chloroflexota bacterium]|nr:acetyl-CoA carboxylase biotin carboxyl carrier protein subunit [Chloroflexota bacterium]